MSILSVVSELNIRTVESYLPGHSRQGKRLKIHLLKVVDPFVTEKVELEVLTRSRTVLGLDYRYSVFIYGYQNDKEPRSGSLRLKFIAITVGYKVTLEM